MFLEARKYVSFRERLVVIPLGNAIEEDIDVFPQSVLIPTDAHGKVCSCYQRKPPAKWSATHTTNL